MKYLKCNAKNCVFNHQEKCTKDELHIGTFELSTGKTNECYDYEDKGIAFTNTEFADEFSTYKTPTYTKDINCKAMACKYNHDTKCTANDVYIKSTYDGEHEAECDTFTIN